MAENLFPALNYKIFLNYFKEGITVNSIMKSDWGNLISLISLFFFLI